MNLIDIFVLLALGLFTLIGWNQGFVKSAFSLANFFISVLIALILYPAVASNIAEDPNIVPTIVHFSESSQMLGGIEYESINIYNVTFPEIESIFNNLQLPHPLAKLALENISNQEYSSVGLATLGEYLGLTIGHMSLNIISFVIVFAISFIFFSIVIAVTDYVFTYPMLKMFDSTAGAILGLFVGMGLVSVVFMSVPLVLAFLPFDEIIGYVDGSNFAHTYYYKNFLINLIKGTIF